MEVFVNERKVRINREVGRWASLGGLGIGLHFFQCGLRAFNLRRYNRFLADKTVEEPIGAWHHGPGDFETAEEYFTRALESHPSVELAKTLGTIRLFELERPQGALEAFQRALELAPRNDPDLETLQEIVEHLEERRQGIGLATVVDHSQSADCQRGRRQRREQKERRQHCRDDAPCPHRSDDQPGVEYYQRESEIFSYDVKSARPSRHRQSDNEQQRRNDPRVPASEAEQIVETVRKNEGEVWYLLAKDEGHGFRKKQNRDYYIQSVVLFLEQYLLK